MLQNIFTIILPIRPGHQDALAELLSALDYKGQAPQADPLGFTELEMLHYASLFLYDDPVDGWSLVFESNIDGQIPTYIEAFITNAQRRGQTELVLDIFQKCKGFATGTVGELGKYLKKYVQLPSAGYSGCVGRSRNQILMEAMIHDLANTVLSQLGNTSDAAQAAKEIRSALDTDPKFKGWEMIPKGTPAGKDLLAAQSLQSRPKKDGILQGISTLLSSLVGALTKALIQEGPLPVLKALFAVVVFIVMAIWNQLRKEPTAAEDTWRPEPAHLRSQRAKEDFFPTNHMVSVVHLHADNTRRWAKWSAFVLLNMLSRYEYTKGVLGAIPTIHFAHWVVINEHRRLMFVSNYDGSWDSYLDDFTLKAASGLTLAWAHGKGIPVTTFMVLGGAAKGPAFIDWARRSMVPTLVWYNAYPHLSIRNINLNSALRQAIANDRDGVNKGKWLELV